MKVDSMAEKDMRSGKNWADLWCELWCGGLGDRRCQPLDPPTCEALDLPWKQLENTRDIQMMEKVT